MRVRTCAIAPRHWNKKEDSCPLLHHFLYVTILICIIINLLYPHFCTLLYPPTAFFLPWLMGFPKDIMCMEKILAHLHERWLLPISDRCQSFTDGRLQIFEEQTFKCLQARFRQTFSTSEWCVKFNWTSKYFALTTHFQKDCLVTKFLPQSKAHLSSS